VAFPVGLHGREKLVPGQLLRVEDEVLDGRQAVDGGPLPIASNVLWSMAPGSTRHACAGRGTRPLPGRAAWTWRGGEVLGLELHRDILLNQGVSGEVVKLRAESVPDLVEACPGARIGRLDANWMSWSTFSLPCRNVISTMTHS